MFLLPVSCLYDLWFYTRSKIVFALSSAPHKHQDKVADVQRQVRVRSEMLKEMESTIICTLR